MTLSFGIAKGMLWGVGSRLLVQDAELEPAGGNFPGIAMNAIGCKVVLSLSLEAFKEALRL